MKPQKALHLHLEAEKKKPKHLTKQYAVFEKYDGWYGYLDTFNGKICSNAGREIPSLQHFARRWTALHRARHPQVYGRYIFEILLTDVADFPTLNGILNRSKGDCEADNAYVKVHDWIEHDESWQLDVPFTDRYGQVCELVQGLNHTRVKVAGAMAICHGGDTRLVKELTNEVWERGGEGIILKEMQGYYQPGKRNCSLLKIKEEVTLDLVVVDYVEGQGKYAGTLGALVVEDAAGNQHTVSGMTDAQRDAWWNNPSLILGQIVEIKAMKRLKDGSLREPRFKAVRFDKRPGEID